MSAPPPNGVLLVDKPEGPTSHDVVAIARRALGTRRIGHTGTLDPFASGLLMLCVGFATRLVEYLVGLPKRYTAVARLGVTTDTDDLTGTPLRTSDAWRDLPEDAIRDALLSQRGERLQVPPAFSAKKIAGERMYDRARRGETVTLDAVPITILDIAVDSIDMPEVGFHVECSSGTYIRSIARDLGESLGTGAHLTRLRRTRIGPHDVQSALRLEQLADAASTSTAFMDPLTALRHLPRVSVSAAEAKLLRNGRAVSREDPLPVGGSIVVEHGGQLLAIGEGHERTIRPRKVFADG